jgi:hypothetical protein
MPPDPHHLLHVRPVAGTGTTGTRAGTALQALAIGALLSFTLPAHGAGSGAGPGAAARTPAPAPERNPAPTAQDWADLGHLPDFSGVWYPRISDQFAQEASNPPPWSPASERQIAELEREEDAGRPKGLFVNCLPEGMPTWMLISHNAMEILFTPGRVTLLGESDGNRLRRIYTDGRGHPDDPDPTFHGHSIGHWEGQTLVVDTIGIAPEAYLAVGEAVGLPNNGGMHVVERIHLSGPDTLNDELEITAPQILSQTWKTTRIFQRHRARRFDIVEGVCRQGDFRSARDAHGNAILVPAHTTADGNVLPP